MFNLSEGSFEGTAKNMMVGGKVKFSQSDYNSAIFSKNNFSNICKTPPTTKSNSLLSQNTDEL